VARPSNRRSSARAGATSAARARDRAPVSAVGRNRRTISAAARARIAGSRFLACCRAARVARDRARGVALGPGATQARPRALTVSRTTARAVTRAACAMLPRRVLEKTRRRPEGERATTRAVARSGRLTRARPTTATRRAAETEADARRHVCCWMPRRPSPPPARGDCPPRSASASAPTRRTPITLNTAATGTRRKRSTAERTTGWLPGRAAEQARPARPAPHPLDLRASGRASRAAVRRTVRALEARVAFILDPPIGGRGGRFPGLRVRCGVFAAIGTARWSP